MESNYEIYVNTECSEIPPEYLREFILQFLYGAAKDMGCDFDKKETPDRVYYIISTHYNHLPLMMIASAFKRGALGQYGAGRLVPRTIYGWLGEINQYYLTKHNVRDNSQDNYTKFDDLHKFPLGKSIIQKIKWYEMGLLNNENWERIDLKKLASKIAEGKQIIFEEYLK